MSTTTARPVDEYKARDYKSELKPIWCPGCGDFGVVQAIYRALAAVGRAPHEIAFVSGIGCSSRIPGYTSAYGFNSVHGRALPIAQGIKLANPELLVLVAGGDGDAFAIGGGHVAHAVDRPHDDGLNAALLRQIVAQALLDLVGALGRHSGGEGRDE